MKKGRVPRGDANPRTRKKGDHHLMRKRLFTLLAWTLFLCFSAFLYSEEINTDVNADKTHF